MTSSDPSESSRWLRRPLSWRRRQHLPFSEGKKIRVQKVRIGCFGIFAGNAEIDSLAPNGDSSEQRIRINIGPKPGKQHEHKGKCRNCENNTAEGCGKLDFVQNCRCNKQFGNAFARTEQCKHDAERENTLCILSGCAQHESRVLPKIVLRFRCFFCAVFGLNFFFVLLSIVSTAFQLFDVCIIAEIRSSCIFRGRIVDWRGRIAVLLPQKAGGVRLCVM